MRASLHNRDCFSSARDDLSRPYPSYKDVYLRSNTSNPGLDEFQDLGLNDFLVAQRQVARQKLEHLQLTPYQGSLFSRGVQPHWEQREPYNAVLEASIGYTASCGVVVMDEVADLNERVDVRMDTGGKGVFTRQAHGEFIVSSETICPPLTHQAHGGHFLKEFLNSPTNYPPGTWWALFKSAYDSTQWKRCGQNGWVLL